MAEQKGIDVSAVRRDQAVRTHPISAAAISIGLVEPSARFSLRLRGPVNNTLAGSIRLEMPINRCEASENRIVARLGPDEWLLISTLADEPSLVREMAVVLAGKIHSLVDIGHSNVAFRVSGSIARAVINSGCPLDLHDSAFPAGSATRTVMGKAAIVLLRPAEVDDYRVECWRSFAPYVAGLLETAAREYALD